MSKYINLLEGPILPSLGALAIPIMAASLIQMAYNLTDMIWIGRIGADAVAAVGAAITGTRGSIPPVTGEGNETRAGRAAMAANSAVLVIVAFQREGTLM